MVSDHYVVRRPRPAPIDRMVNDIDEDRHRFLGAAAVTLGAARFGAMAFGTVPTSAATRDSVVPAATRDTFDSIKQIDAGVLNVGYAESGPANGQPVLLLHGWPYDIHAFGEVAPI